MKSARRLVSSLILSFGARSAPVSMELKDMQCSVASLSQVTMHLCGISERGNNLAQLFIAATTKFRDGGRGH